MFFLFRHENSCVTHYKRLTDSGVALWFHLGHPCVPPSVFLSICQFVPPSVVCPYFRFWMIT